MKRSTFFMSVGVLSLSAPTWSSDNYEISERGYWIGEVPECHAFDGVLAQAIANFFIEEQAQAVVDFGCGTGAYVAHLRKSGISAEGYDGNPETAALSSGIGKVLDLSQPVHLDAVDWVMSLEVGEHLPKQYETTFIENLMRHAKKGIVLSWAVKGQGGTGHFNEQDNDYIKAIFAKQGYINDLGAETQLREKAQCGWFARSLMVFRKP